MKFRFLEKSSTTSRTSRNFTRLALLFIAGLFTPACERGDGEGGTIPPPSRETHPSPARFLFVDAAREVGIDFRHDRGESKDLHMYEVFCGGAAWLDYDRDGDPDLYLVSGQPPGPDGRYSRDGKNRLYRNDGGRFVDVTGEAGVAGRGYATGTAVGDIDNDGYPDLLVICFGEMILYHNRGNGTFQEVADSGVEGGEPFSGSALFADFDGDGLLDLFVASYVHYDVQRPVHCSERRLSTGEKISTYCGPVNYRGTPNRVFRNLGGGKFQEVSRESGVGLGADADSKSLGSLAADFDEDGDVDVYVACDTTPNLLFRNRGDGTFEEVGLKAGSAVSDTGINEGSMGVALGDANGDGIADLFVTNFQDESNRLYLGSREGIFLDGTLMSGLGYGSLSLVGWGAAFLDADRDGSVELFVSSGHIYHNAEEWIPGKTYFQEFLFYVKEGNGYRECREEAGEVLERRGPFRGAALADYDLDGDVDILVMVLDSPPLLLRNDSAPGHWLEVDLVGRGPGGRDAVGAKVEIQTPAGRQFRWRFGGGSYISASEPRLHFGLGGEHRVERLQVTWPGGARTVMEDLPADRRIVVEK